MHKVRLYDGGMNLLKIKTPCVGICSTGIGDEVCRGCKRYAHEVIDWNGFTEQQKSMIEARLVGFLTQIIQNKWSIINRELLQWQIQIQPILISGHRNEYCQSFDLIKAGASQISDIEQFGIRLQPGAEGKTLKKLCEEIDREFYALSVAHYERYFSHTKSMG